jgi:hypothetical protein
MCLIVDANAAGDFLARRSAVTEWLLGSKGKPRLVAAAKLNEELFRIEPVRRLLVQFRGPGFSGLSRPKLCASKKSGYTRKIIADRMIFTYWPWQLSAGLELWLRTIER